MMIRSNLLAVLAMTFAVAAASIQAGDTCGVTSTDFLQYSYQSEYLVAGEAGCTLGDDTGCFCAPDLDDGESLSEWKWQCNNSVDFGPTSADKVCPDVVPVAKGLGDLDVVLNRRMLQGQQQQRVSCDTDIHPTGRPGDEVCPYSDCDEGGDHSAICACIDLEQYGMGEGMEWVCMHATCNCGDEDGNQEATDDALDANANLPGASAGAPTSLISLSLMAVFALINTV